MTNDVVVAVDVAAEAAVVGARLTVTLILIFTAATNTIETDAAAAAAATNSRAFHVR